MGKVKEKIIEKGAGLIAKSKTKKKLQKYVPEQIHYGRKRTVCVTFSPYLAQSYLDKLPPKGVRK